jgi:hypothetical protein
LKIPLIAAFILGLAVCLVPSCATPAQNQQAIAEVEHAKEVLKSQFQTLEQQRIEALNQGRLQDAAKYAELQTKVQGLQAKADQAGVVLAKFINPDGSVKPNAAQTGVDELSKYIPFPYNLVLLIGGPLAIGWWKQLQVNDAKGAAVSIINGIEALKAKSEPFRAVLSTGKATLLSEYSETAKALVAEHKLAA